MVFNLYLLYLLITYILLYVIIIIIIQYYTQQKIMMYTVNYSVNFTVKQFHLIMPSAEAIALIKKLIIYINIYIRR